MPNLYTRILFRCLKKKIERNLLVHLRCPLHSLKTIKYMRFCNYYLYIIELTFICIIRCLYLWILFVNEYVWSSAQSQPVKTFACTKTTVHFRSPQAPHTSLFLNETNFKKNMYNNRRAVLLGLVFLINILLTCCSTSTEQDSITEREAPIQVRSTLIK